MERVLRNFNSNFMKIIVLVYTIIKCENFTGHSNYHTPCIGLYLVIDRHYSIHSAYPKK